MLDIPPLPPVLEEHEINKFGYILKDSFYQLQDNNWATGIKDKKILEYIKKENEYSSAFMDQHSDMEEVIFQELKGRVPANESSVPLIRDQYAYYIKYKEGEEYPIVYRCPHNDLNVGELMDDKNKKSEEEMLNANKLAEGHKFFNIGALSVSHDHRFAAYSYDIAGNEQYVIKVKDLKTQETFVDHIDGSIGNVYWDKTNSGFYYVSSLNAKCLPNKVMYHKLGDTDTNKDLVIYEEQNDGFFPGLDWSANKDKLFVISGNVMGNYETYVINEDNSLNLLISRTNNIKHYIDYRDGWYYIRLNDQGENFRLVKTQDPTNKEKYEAIISHSRYNAITDFALYKNHLVVQMNNEGIAKILISHSDQENDLRPLNVEGESYQLDLDYTTFDDKYLRYVYSSLVQPRTVMEYNFKTKESFVRKVQKIPSGYDANLYDTKRITATSHDGTLVPISLVYKKDKLQESDNPLLLYGYGAHGVATPPCFRRDILSMLDRGVVFAIAHIRGGSDLGYYWYEDGKMFNKHNSFQDYISCAEKLIADQYTSAGNIMALGGSSGGLLMGAVTNMRPDLFSSVVAMVPVVDLINSGFNESLRLTKITFWTEYGNPNKKEEFENLLSYSPYDNITKQNYPPMLITSGVNDPRVPYWEALKWVAKLRTHKTDDNILLLKMHMGSGHSGPSGRYHALREKATIYNFMLAIHKANQDGKVHSKNQDK